MFQKYKFLCKSFDYIIDIHTAHRCWCASRREELSRIIIRAHIKKWETSYDPPINVHLVKEMRINKKKIGDFEARQKI